MKTQPDGRVGVIVARFQVPDLHEGHVELLNHVTSTHGRVVVVLGTSIIPCTLRDPLDYPTRARMVQDQFKDVIVVPLSDMPDDAAWSKALDGLLTSLFPNDTFALYSGRDGFHKAYCGRYANCINQFDTVTVREGTTERAIASSRPLLTSDERRGAIYAIARKYPATHCVVDVAVTSDNANGEPVVLVGRKANETGSGHRFIGGFVEVGETLEQAAARELGEEAGLRLQPIDFHYVRSFHINDWRYRNTGEGITSSLMHAHVPFEFMAGARAGDDMHKVTIVPLNQLSMLDLHQPLLVALRAYIDSGDMARRLIPTTTF